MNRSYSKIRHIQQSNMILEQRRKNLIGESAVDLGTMTLYWTTCGGDNVVLSDESKKKLQLDGMVSGNQQLHFVQEPSDVHGEFKIMDCLGPEVGKTNDMYIDTFEGKNYLTKNYS